MENCSSSGNVTAETVYIAFAGGIVGYNEDGKVANSSKHSGTVSATAINAHTGGVIGSSESYYPTIIFGNAFSRAATGQQWGIGWVYRDIPPGPSNNGCTDNP